MLTRYCPLDKTGVVVNESEMLVLIDNTGQLAPSYTFPCDKQPNGRHFINEATVLDVARLLINRGARIKYVQPTLPEADAVERDVISAMLGLVWPCDVENVELTSDDAFDALAEREFGQ